MHWKKWLLLSSFLILIGTAYFLGLFERLTFEELKNHRKNLLIFVEKYPYLSPLIFMAIYAFFVSLSIPGGAILSLAGGFLFGTLKGTILVIIGATTGASMIFYAAKSIFKELFKKKTAPFLNKMEKGFQTNAANYLLFLRFIPLFPFWLINLAPAFFQVSFWTFFWTTCIGITPGSYIYTQAGSGLGKIFEKGEDFSMDHIFNFEIKIALFLLALFILIPICIKHVARKRSEKK